MPNFVFNLRETPDILSERLVAEALIPLFRKLHPEKNGWNLSLVNVAATNMVDAASDKGGAGRDISKMFKRQDDILKQWRVEDEDHAHGMGTDVVNEHRPDDTVDRDVTKLENDRVGSEDFPTTSQQSTGDGGAWESEDEDMLDDDMFRCECGAVMPVFAMAAHGRWHEQN